MNEKTWVLVWDLPVRIFHWLLVSLFAASWITATLGGVALKYHFWSGYSILVLVLFRIGWGFVGGIYARFGTFLHGPRQVLAALRELASRRPTQSVGHNPLGGWMVFFLLLELLTQALTGLCANDDIFNEGPWAGHLTKAVSDRLTGLHHVYFKVLLGLVMVHMAAIAYHRFVKGENLVVPMLTGYKWVSASVPRRINLWRGAMVFFGAAVFVVLIVNC